MWNWAKTHRKRLLCSVVWVSLLSKYISRGIRITFSQQIFVSLGTAMNIILNPEIFSPFSSVSLVIIYLSIIVNVRNIGLSMQSHTNCSLNPPSAVQSLYPSWQHCLTFDSCCRPRQFFLRLFFHTNRMLQRPFRVAVQNWSSHLFLYYLHVSATFKIVCARRLLEQCLHIFWQFLCRYLGLYFTICLVHNMVQTIIRRTVTRNLAGEVYIFFFFCNFCKA
jgi:hypothetical protein